MNKPIAQFRHLLIVYVFSLFIIIPTFSQQPESKSGGDAWSQGTDMPAARSWHVVAGVNGKIYAIGGNLSEYSSTEEYDPGIETSIQNSVIKPVYFHLHQNYPNPFNQTTHISFNVQKNCKVTLQVYDMMGRRVSTLVNQNMNEGNYRVQFDGKGLYSGIYHYKIEMENYSKTRLMLLNK